MWERVSLVDHYRGKIPKKKLGGIWIKFEILDYLGIIPGKARREFEKISNLSF
jgi:hypothetical protein